MLKAILIDDEVHCLESLRFLLNEYCPDVEIVEECLSGRKAIEAIARFSPNLVFLDIEMPGMNGFQVLEELKELTFSIIFTTSYDRYAIKAIKYSALDYLLKPIDPTELTTAIDRINESGRFPFAEQFQMLLKKMQTKDHRFNKVAVPTTTGFELILSDQIIRCEANDNYTHLFLKDKSKIIACRTLKEMEEQLQDFDFFIRVHHSYLVNLNEVTRYVRGEGGYLVMTDGSTVNVSKSRKESLMKWF